MIFSILEAKNYHILGSMKINHDCKNNQLSDTLSTFLKKNINLAHIKLISLFIVALCKAKTVCFSLLSTVFDSPAKSSSCLRRIQRFFAEFDLDRDLIARVIFRLLPIKGPFCLAIDRTNWQFGSTDINIFMLAVVHDGVAYPLLFSILPKKGTSNTKERIELVQRYVRLFGTESIDCLLADREFVGEHWVKWLNDNGIRYHIRIRENFWVARPSSGGRAKASWLFTDLRVGEAKCLHKIYYVNGQACYLSASRVKGRDGRPELQILISYNRPEESLDTYKKRWQIETMFKAMKSAGFNIEDTHLADLHRIGKLLLLVMIAFVWCYNIGELVRLKYNPIRILKHGRKAKSIFRYGLDIVTEFLLRGRNEYKIPIFDFSAIANQILTPD